MYMSFVGPKTVKVDLPPQTCNHQTIYRENGKGNQIQHAHFSEALPVNSVYVLQMHADLNSTL